MIEQASCPSPQQRSFCGRAPTLIILWALTATFRFYITTEDTHRDPL